MRKPTVWAKIKKFFCGMPNGTVLHGEKIESILDLTVFERAKKLKSSAVFIIR